jgi:hypothetical protein
MAVGERRIRGVSRDLGFAGVRGNPSVSPLGSRLAEHGGAATFAPEPWWMAGDHIEIARTRYAEQDHWGARVGKERPEAGCDGRRQLLRATDVASRAVVLHLIEEVRFAFDSPLEGGVSCELVSEIKI